MQEMIRPEIQVVKKKKSHFYFRSYLKNHNFLIGFSIILLVIFIALLSFFYTPHNPQTMSIRDRIAPPSPTHPFGRDDYGRDILSRIMVGSTTAVGVGLVAVGIGLGAGVLIGAIAGFFSGRIDEILMRIMDGMYAFPPLLFAIMVVAVLGPGLFNTMIAIGVVNIPIFARITRACFLSLREKEFVEAAQALGANSMQVIFRHLLPNALAPIIVQGTVSFATAIISEASLSYLGLGTQPPHPSWGRMLREAQNFMARAPWMAIAPGISIAITVLGFNLLGDGLRDILDPRTFKD